MNVFIQALLCFLLFFLSGCGPRSLDDFEEEGEGVMRSLIEELRNIHSRNQLIASSGRLKRHYDRLVDIMIAAQNFRDNHPGLDKGVFSGPNHELSDQLRIELNRIYQIEGGRQIIEKCEQNALNRLSREK